MKICSVVDGECSIARSEDYFHFRNNCVLNCPHFYFYSIFNKTCSLGVERIEICNHWAAWCESHYLLDDVALQNLLYEMEKKTSQGNFCCDKDLTF